MVGSRPLAAPKISTPEVLRLEPLTEPRPRRLADLDQPGRLAEGEPVRRQRAEQDLVVVPRDSRRRRRPLRLPPRRPIEKGRSSTAVLMVTSSPSAHLGRLITISTRGHDPPCSQQPRYLHGQAARHAGRTLDQDRLAAVQALRDGHAHGGDGAGRARPRRRARCRPGSARSPLRRRPPSRPGRRMGSQVAEAHQSTVRQVPMPSKHGMAGNSVIIASRA